MEKMFLKICREVLDKDWNSNKNLSCENIKCEECLFHEDGGLYGCGDLNTKAFKEIAQEYINKHEPKNKFKIGDIVTGVNKSQWLSNGNYKIVRMSTIEYGKLRYGVEGINVEEPTQSCIWKESDMRLSNITEIKGEDNMKTKYTYKELITEWDNISQGDRYIGLENNRGLTIYKDSDGGVAIEYEDGVLGNEVLYIDIEGLFELQKPLTLDDFEIGEEFKVNDRDGKFMKVKVFGSTMIARKADFGDISVLLYTIEDLNGSELIKIKGDK